MAYAAVVSLMQILENILHTHLGDRQIPWEKQQIESLLESMDCFHDFLERSWRKRSRPARCLERKIRHVAYKAEDVIESYMSKHFFTKTGGEKRTRSEIIIQHLKIVVEEIVSIKLKVTRLVDLWEGAKDLNFTQCLPLASCGDYTMVGFEDDSLQLLERIVGQQSEKLRIIPVVGMGGIGKTTLVKNVYKKSIEYSFDVAAWVTVSQNYRERNILLGLLESMRMLTDDMYQKSDGELSDCLYKCLKGKKYLIVMDDLWHKQAWGNIKRLLPDDSKGSRVLLTTRQSDVAAYANSFEPDHHHMRLLNEDESWEMFCSKVFRDGCCLPELEEVGKKIVRSCNGLPLSIVVISGLLSNVLRTRSEWENIAKNLNSVIISRGRQCTELLSLSYDHLPHHLRACFLYAGVYPQDFEIQTSKLIKLWIAEGFIKPNSSKSLEEVGEDYLEDLMSRNLVLVGEKRYNGKIKSCIIHDLLREWCLSKALDEKFIHTLNANIYYCQEIAKDRRRLFIRKDSIDEARADILRTIGPFSLVRSLVSQSKPHDELWSCCKLLKVLDLPNVDLEFFPDSRICLIMVML
ncbi:disease resistance protein RPP13-like [Primulina eburnea]|uniref:disease resistance protein RPP13-like n=1 Tax=Primulina eburnea TaxID=1245227 RepID=UPI003C6C4767